MDHPCTINKGVNLGEILHEGSGDTLGGGLIEQV